MKLTYVIECVYPGGASHRSFLSSRFCDNTQTCELQNKKSLQRSENCHFQCLSGLISADVSIHWCSNRAISCSHLGVLKTSTSQVHTRLFNSEFLGAESQPLCMRPASGYSVWPRERTTVWKCVGQCLVGVLLLIGFVIHNNAHLSS